MSDIVYGIRITGDASSAKREFADTKRAQEGLTGAERENARTSAEIERANERKTAALNRLRLAAIAAGVAMLAMLRQTTSAAIEAERSIARLNAVWTATGGSSGLSRAGIEGLVQRTVDTSRFDDETIRDSISVLSTFRQVSGKTFEETIAIAAGLSEVLGTDLQSSVVMLGRALEDPVQGLDALRRVGVIFGESQREMIKDLVESGRQLEAQQIILRELKTKGFDVVADAMNQGMAAAMSDAKKNWNDVLEAFGRTELVQAPVTGFFGSLAEYLKRVKLVVEDGTWLERLTFFTVGYSSKRIDDMASAPGARDDNSAEAAGARRSAQEARWQVDFDRQQAQMREFLKKRDEEAKRRAKDQAADRAGVAADSAAALQAQQDILDEADRLGVRFLQQQEQKRLALEKEGEAVRDAIDPWNAYAREVERLRALMDKGAISQREFGEAVAREAGKVGDAVEMMADKGTSAFDELRDAIEGWGQDLSRELARGEVSLKSFARIAEELLAMQIQRRIMQPLLNAGTSWIDGLFAGSGTSAAAYTGNAAPFHTGGIVGLEGGARRYVHPAYFERAPRLHSGGLAGDEVPAILRRGEGVFTPEQMRAMGGGSNLTVKVINETGVPVQGQASAPRVDATGLVVDLVLRRLAVDANARQQLAGQLTKPQH